MVSDMLRNHELQQERRVDIYREALVEKFRNFEWDYSFSFGVESQLRIIQSTWEEMQEEEIDFNPITATLIVIAALPDLLKPLAKKIVRDLYEYSPGVRGTINFEIFIARLIGEWRYFIFENDSIV